MGDRHSRWRPTETSSSNKKRRSSSSSSSCCCCFSCCCRCCSNCCYCLCCYCIGFIINTLMWCINTFTKYSYHVVALDALLDGGLSHSSLLVELVTGYEVERQRDGHVLRLGLVHQLLDDLRAFLVEQRLADLQAQHNSTGTRCSLRSADVRTCVLPPTLSSYGDTTFAAAGPRLWSSCAIQTSSTDCSGDSWSDTFFGKPERAAQWLLICGALEKHVLTYLHTYLLTYLTVLISNFQSLWNNAKTLTASSRDNGRDFGAMSGEQNQHLPFNMSTAVVNNKCHALQVLQ